MGVVAIWHILIERLFGPKHTFSPGKTNACGTKIPGEQLGRRAGARGAHSIFGSMKTSAFLMNTQSRFASVIHDSVQGPLRLGRYS